MVRYSPGSTMVAPYNYLLEKDMGITQHWKSILETIEDFKSNQAVDLTCSTRPLILQVDRFQRSVTKHI